jgi:AraC family transcriptional regulator
MDRCRNDMDNIGPKEATALLSQQVTAARYFFLHLATGRKLGFTLVMGGREHCNPDYALVRRYFPFHGLECVVAGRGWVTLDGKEQALGPGTVFAYAPNTHCALRADPRDPMVKYFISMRGRGAAARLQRSGVKPGEVRVLAVPAEVTRVLEELVHEGQRTGPLTPAICAALGELLFLKIEATVTQATATIEPSRAAFLRCKALIDARAEQLGTLADIAQAAAAEASSVCRWFRRYQGTSPYQYLLRRKMTLAAEFLIENGGLVKEAAQRVGFDDPFHFSRVFKAVHGVAPRALLHYRPIR